MESQGLSVGEVAERLAISPATVRRYADRYAGHLSPGASGRPRGFTDGDVQKLSEAFRLASLHVEAEAITARLQSLTIGDVLSPEGTQVDTSAPQGHPTAPHQNGAEPLQLPAPMVDALIARLDAAERSARDKTWVFIVGFAAGIGAMAGLVLIMLGLAALAG